MLLEFVSSGDAWPNCLEHLFGRTYGKIQAAEGRTLLAAPAAEQASQLVAQSTVLPNPAFLAGHECPRVAGLSLKSRCSSFLLFFLPQRVVSGEGQGTVSSSFSLAQE